ncbi:Ubiquitin family protein [Aphelenchoides avenae]|nr:Ubiquitin family protein [Aphelenchus avenae]
MHDRSRSSSSSSHSESESSEDDAHGSQQPNQQTSVVIIQTPSAVTSTDSTPAPLRAENTDNSSERHYTIDLPADGNENINEIHRILRANTDNAIATAATIALYNRRFTENNPSANPLLVSRVSVNVESEESPPPHNILISYDTLQAVTEGSTETDGTTGGSSTTSVTVNEQHPQSSTDGAAEQVPGEPSSSGDGSQTPEVPSNNEGPPSDGENAPIIKLKFLDDTQRTARAWLSTTVGEFKKNYFSDVLTTGKVVRLIFQGQLLRDDTRSLESYGLHDQCVVHCHVGTRPYSQPASSNNGNGQSNTGAQNDGNQPNAGAVPGGYIGSRIVTTGMAWVDLVLYATWTIMLHCFTWIQTPADVSDNPQMPTTQRVLFGIKRVLRVVLSTLVDVNAAQQNAAAADDPFSNRFNAGFILGLLFAMKFIMLWMFVFYFPQYTDPRGIFLLTVLTAVTASYFFFNRATPQRAHQY